MPIKHKEQIFDKLFNLLNDLSEEEIHDFFAHEKICKLLPNKNINNSLFNNNIENVNNAYIKYIVINEIQKVNTNLLYFFRDFINNRCYSNMNIMQVNEMVNKNVPPFMLCYLVESEIDSFKKQEELIDEFNKYDVKISIVTKECKSIS